MNNDEKDDEDGINPTDHCQSTFRERRRNHQRTISAVVVVADGIDNEQIWRFGWVLPSLFPSLFSLLLSPKQELSSHCLSLVCLLFSLFLWCVGVLWILRVLFAVGGKKNIWYLFFHLIGQMIDVFI